MKLAVWCCLFGVFLVGISGCKGGNAAKAEQLAQSLINEMNNLATGLENGDKAAVMQTVTKLKSLNVEAKAVKVTKSQDDAIKKKFDPKLEEVKKRMMSSIVKAQTSGKFTPADLTEIGNALQSMK